MSRIIVNKDIAEQSEVAADLFVEVANAAIGSTGSLSVALAGGSTPRTLYSLLASDAYSDKIDWSKVTFFFGDERNVPPDSPDSNFRMASETILMVPTIETRKVHRWRTELNHERAAADYEKQLQQHFGSPLPRFDIFLLGLGTDGHTASLFPHCPEIRISRQLAISTWVSKLGEQRLTMTFPVINNASSVIFLVSGEEKAATVRNVVEGDFLPDEFPAQLVKPTSGDLYWLLDEAAASTLEG